MQKHFADKCLDEVLNDISHSSSPDDIKVILVNVPLTIRLKATARALTTY
jgi:hypothetical protein